MPAHSAPLCVSYARPLNTRGEGGSPRVECKPTYAHARLESTKADGCSGSGSSSMEFLFADSVGTFCNTSRCSTTLPFASSRKISIPALSASPSHPWRVWANTRTKRTRLPGWSFSHSFEEFNETLLPVSDRRIVLNVRLTNVAFRSTWPRLIEHQIAECCDCLFVLLKFRAAAPANFLHNTPTKPVPNAISQRRPKNCRVRTESTRLAGNRLPPR